MKVQFFNIMSFKSSIRRFKGLFFLFFPVVISAQTVQLHWIDKKPISETGVSWGVPFEKGKIQPKQSFILSNAEGVNIPVQSWPLAYWPDGSVKWMGFAATVPPTENFQLQPIAKSKNPEKLLVSDFADNMVVDNEIFTCKIRKKGKVLFDNISIKNKVVSENGRLICTLENREKLNERIISYDDFESKISDVKLEQSGAVRAVVKISGVFLSAQSGREIFPFTVRLYFYKGATSIKMVYSFVYDGNQDKDFIKGLGVVFDVPMREPEYNRHVRFSGENGGLWSEAVKPISTRSPFVYNGDRTLPEKQFAGETLPEITAQDAVAYRNILNLASWDDYKLSQLNPNGFSVSKRTNSKSSWLHADDGKRASGLALVGDVTGGMAVSLKDFWQSYPAALEVNHARSDKAQLKVWLWSPDAEAMDLRHYDTVPHNLLTTYEDIQEGLSTPYGVARTSELTLFPFESLPDKYETIAMASMGQNSPQLICTPEYLHAVKAFGTWSLPDKSNETKRWIENQLDSSILYYQQSIDERHWYGFWNYGDVMHTYDPTRHIWKYDIGGFAWDNTELAPNNWLWYSFLRTGRADIYRMAEAMTRHTSEVDAYHLGEMKGLGSRHNVSHWGCGSKEARIGQAAWKRFYYYLTTDERSGDLMREAMEVEKSLVKFEPLRIAQPREKFPYGGPMRLRWGPDWLALAGNWMTEWERTGDKIYRDKILVGLESLTKLPDNLFTGPNGLSYDPQTGKLWYDGKPGLTNINHLSTIMGGFEMLTEMFDMIDYKPFRKTFTDYCRFYGMDKDDPARTPETQKWGDVGFRTPRLTAFAAEELNDDKIAERAWREFLGGWSKTSRDTKGIGRNYGVKLLADENVLNPVHENPFVGTNGTAQWGLNAIIMLELIGDKLPDAQRNEEQKTFENLLLQKNELLFKDDFSKSWTTNWFLDGQKAQLKNTKAGLLFKAGEVPASDADHAVLWTKQSFDGDIRIEFDFTKKDIATKFVNIIYLFAEGSGVGAYDKDISKWNNLRTVPAMKNYFEHMNAYHISFAAFENDNTIRSEDYVRARRYLPERGRGLVGTELTPDYLRTGMFAQGVKHHVTIIKKGNDIFMQVKNADKVKLFHWSVADFPALNSGRIGLRLMGSRISEFGNFKVYKLQ